MKTFIRYALSERLRALATEAPAREPGWLEVFGQVPAEEAAAIAAIVEREFESVEPADWR